VAYANVRDVMNSELRQRLRKFEGVTDEGRSEFKTRTGIDIEQDIDHVVACMGAAGGAERTKLVVVTGRFDSKRMGDGPEHGGKAEAYGTRLISVARGRTRARAQSRDGDGLPMPASWRSALPAWREAVDHAGGTTSCQHRVDAARRRHEQRERGRRT
jgi:hypothetical protein